MKVLVIGGSGFIGSHVVDKVALAGHEPLIYDLQPSPHHAPGEYPTFIGDLLDREALTVAMRECDAAIHLAAVADVNHVAADPAFSEKINSRGTAEVLEAARAAELGRLVYTSTIWVYNGIDGAVDETTGLQLPTHFYTATKLAGEMYCRSYAELFGVECSIMRLGIPYGPRARQAAVIPAFVRKALSGEPLTLTGNGDQTRRFVYVEDLAEGIVAGLQPIAANRVYNLVGEEEVTIMDIAQLVKGLVGDVDIVRTEPRPGDFGGAEVSGARAERELGWTPRTSFAEGVEKYYEWHLRHIHRPPVGEADAALS